MPVNHSKILDSITQAKKAEPLFEKGYSYKTPSREQALGLSYDRGEVIVDKVTGKEGEVIGGTRAAVTEG
jgi:hypothetical protein